MHSMKLHGPWMLFADADQPNPDRVKLPGQVLLGEVPVNSPCVLRRRFGTPTGLTDSDHVLLVIQRPTLGTIASLECGKLGTVESESTIGFDITASLTGNNYLQLEFTVHDIPVFVEEVRLDIADESELNNTGYRILRPQ